MILKGIIVKESLVDEKLLESFNVLEILETDDAKVEDRWHIYTVEIDKELLSVTSKNIKSGPWYCHFWDKDNLFVVFKNKVMHLNRGDEMALRECVRYGVSIGIPKEQLDFKI